MVTHRKLLILALLVGALAGAGSLAYRYVRQPPRLARLLPEGNLIVYANLIPLHYVDLGQLPGQSDPEYQDFVRQTGIHVEHDLDRIAAAFGDPSDQNAISAVFTGSFDQARLSAYLLAISPETETYAGKTVFIGRYTGHTIRVCILDPKTVVVANSESAQPMRHMIDASRAPSPPASLLDGYYHYVPLGSSAWVIFRPPPETSRYADSLAFLQHSTSVISVRYTGSIRIRIEVISQNEADAARVREAANELVAMARPAAVSLSAKGADKDIKSAFDSIEIQQNANHTVVNAIIPQAVVEHVMARLNQ